MRVEGCGLEHFGKRQFHLVCQRCEMCRRYLAVGVLDQVQMLDQEIAAPRPVRQQPLDFVRSDGIDLAALRGRLGSFPPCARMFELADFLYVVDHRISALSDLDRL